LVWALVRLSRLAASSAEHFTLTVVVVNGDRAVTNRLALDWSEFESVGNRV
jgi:hypothetical protein